MYSKMAASDIPATHQMLDSVAKYAAIEEPDGADGWRLWTDVWHARMYLNTSQYDTCEKILLNAIEGYDALETIEEGFYQIRLHTELASLYYELFDFERSFYHIKKARLLITPEDHAERWRIYGQLQGNYYMLGQLDSAQHYNDLVLGSIDLDTNSRANMVSRIKGDRALIESGLDNHTAAVQWMDEAVGTFPEYYRQTRNYALLLRMQGEMLLAANEYSQARGALLESRQVYGKSDHDAAWLFNLEAKMGNCFMGLGEWDSAYSLYSSLPRRFKAYVYFNTKNLSNREKELFLNRNRIVGNSLLTFLAHAEGDHLAFHSEVLDYVLYFKGFAMRSMKTMIESLDDSQTVKSEFEHWKQLRDDYYRLLSKEGAASAELEDAAFAIGRKEKEMLRASNSQAAHRKTELVVESDIRSILGPNEAAIEFARFNDLLKGEEVHYGAFVVLPQNDFPEFIVLCSEAELEQAIARNLGETDFEYVKRMYDSESPLFDLVWSAILKKTTSVSHFYVAYAGLLHGIAHDVVQLPDGQMLSENRAITILNSTSDLVNYSPYRVSKSTTASLFGGICFDCEDTLNFAGTNAGVGLDWDAVNCGKDGFGQWEYLPATLAEVQEVNAFLRSNGLSSRMIVGLAASEQAIKALDGTQTEILHISTHGYNIKSKAEFSSPSFSMNYAKSGLVMAEANYISPADEQGSGAGDGILTAPEIAALNLTNTNLVVLSACESGLGAVSRTEEVYGLQRSFDIAGVDHIIYTLWKIPDAPSKEFMELFYSNLSSGTALDQAFEGAKKEMKIKYSPYYWAGFQLIN